MNTPQCQVDWMCFFSPSGVKAIHEELQKRATTATQELSSRLAAIGPTTAKAVSDTFGKPPDAIASSPCALALFGAIGSS
jgi:uroporphyrinogen-III synthase